MFPGGAKLKYRSKWEAGVGYIINHIDNAEAQIIFVKLKNTYRSDIMKFTRLNLFNKNRKVYADVEPD